MKRLFVLRKQFTQLKMNQSITYLSQKEAYESDQDLMSQRVGYSIDILMELAGQSVAHCFHHINKKYHSQKLKNILVICGPGNNGGDGMVAARHIAHLDKAYKLTILLLKVPAKDFFINQLNICKQYSIPIKELPNEIDVNATNALEKTQLLFKSYDIVIDALFGFSFQPPVKPPSDIVLQALKNVDVPIYSVDIPSGWDVEKGNIHNSFNPSYLISLTLPKEGSRNFKGKHFVGGRFVPYEFSEKYKWVMPEYKENETFVELE
ncbi:hypothetical protein ABPG74_016396 [Tetrahymena malaccensis]